MELSSSSHGVFRVSAFLCTQYALVQDPLEPVHVQFW
ncbi:hypothetical protein A2U01_0081049, partial [Trifolium medium]|nr:hypothetical protein [Trifolium medium]